MFPFDTPSRSEFNDVVMSLHLANVSLLALQKQIDILTQRITVLALRETVSE